MVSIDEQVEILMSGAEYGDPETKVTMARELRERLIEAEEAGRPLRVYCGYDPRKPDLHLGHTITMRKLRQFQELGHDVTFLIGTFTSLIGDPSDKDKARNQLTVDEVRENARTYAEQAFKILDPDLTRVRYNDEWLSTLDFADIIRLASNFTVQQFLVRENFANRIRDGLPIYLHEFFYALMQAYDAVAQEADVQVGGQDQLFNIVVAGRKLQQGLGQKPQIAIIMGESLPGTDGHEKMSKSQGNHIPLLGEPWDMYGKVMSIPDVAMPIYYKLILGWTPAQLSEFEHALKDGSLHPNEAKMRLAREIVSIFHSPDDAVSAQQRWDEVFRSKGGPGIPTDIPTATIEADERVVDVLRRLNMVASGKEAARLIEQGGIRLADQPVTELSALVRVVDLPAVLQVGKRKFVKLINED
ncbi:MAG: tyrosine--tRNA ligase [Chloroflexi bacterium]|jgi:tyrosyl-tRNA synthetase|nr:MAG: tyrosyl-tRNA synthetase [Chloroflexi bacterium OLB13]MBC6955405.1 tyrosine--tRNA ligase [Chloroflexota bacterium]MBV6435411.1 Tyrosine--tRNA ligase [Anaerolineae bacterium]MDL1915297.1 tyrosine--tRNA ligase [Anaerolineae bacterium CFX4]MBW7878302.1 tyrosine--tRNA ligase [Anaerolineae bacterium]